MTLAEWRARPDLVGETRKLFMDPIFMKIREMLDAEHPHNYHTPLVNTTAELELGRSRGYDNCLSNLDACAIPLPAIEPVKETWGMEEEK